MGWMSQELPFLVFLAQGRRDYSEIQGKCTEIGMAAWFGSVLNRRNFSAIGEEGGRLENFSGGRCWRVMKTNKKNQIFLKFYGYLKNKWKLSLFLLGMGAVC